MTLLWILLRSGPGLVLLGGLAGFALYTAGNIKGWASQSAKASVQLQTSQNALEAVLRDRAENQIIARRDRARADQLAQLNQTLKDDNVKISQKLAQLKLSADCSRCRISAQRVRLLNFTTTVHRAKDRRKRKRRR